MQLVKAAYREALHGVSAAHSSVRTGTSVWNGTHLWGIWKKEGEEGVEVAPCCLIQDCLHLLIYFYLLRQNFTV